MTTERDDIGRALAAAARADGRGYGQQQRRTEVDSRRRQRRLILPGALGAALLLALLAGVIANQVGGPDLARVPANAAAAPAPDYASDYGTEHDPFVIQSSRPRSAVLADYRLSAPNETELTGDVREATPAAPAQRRVPAQGPAWFDARDYGVTVPGPAVTDDDQGPCRKPWRACDR